MELRPLSGAFDDEIDPPVISTEIWLAGLPANDYTIRAALLTCRGSTNPAGTRAMIYREDRRQLFVRHEKKRGWQLDLAWSGSRRDSVAVRAGSVPPDRVIAWSLLKAVILKPPGGYFEDREAELVMRAFMQGGSDPFFLQWCKLDWR